MEQTRYFEGEWDKVLKNETTKDYFGILMDRIAEERQNYVIYPSEKNQFSAFNATPFEKVKVVILGQDPYHGAGQAHGLSFSVPVGIAIPRSLKNIFKELKSDLGYAVPEHGNLEKWAEQGVLLLNTILSVREKTPKSHHKMGWEIFTDAVIRTLSENRTDLVFMLWGNDAQQKIPLIDSNKHSILKAAHPSPFSAAKGFLGCCHFSKANNLLFQSGQEIIDWKL